MKKLEDLIKRLSELDVITNQQISATLRDELSDALCEIAFDIEAKERNNVSDVQLTNKDKVIESLKSKVSYLEGFIVQIARESREL